MSRNSKLGGPDKSIQTVCVGGVYIIDRRIYYDRRYKVQKINLKYNRRLSSCIRSLNRRNRQLVDIII